MNMIFLDRYIIYVYIDNSVLFNILDMWAAWAAQYTWRVSDVSCSIYLTRERRELLNMLDAWAA